jgi:hypothetical protein
MKEIFKPIEGYENYEISNYGRVRSLKRNIILNQKINDDGFCYILLLNNDKFKKHLIHNLVKYTFMENPYNYSIVEHIDNDLMNNRIDNLKFLLYTEPYKINFKNNII